MSMSPIYLTEEDKKTVEKYAKTGTHNVHLVIRANILLILDRTGKKDHTRIKQTAEAYGVSRQTVYKIMEDYHNSTEAFRLSQKLEIHYTPTHGSWQFTASDAGIKLKHLYPVIQM